MDKKSRKRQYSIAITSVLFIALVIYHMRYRLPQGDTVFFLEHMRQYSFIEFVEWRYLTASSRVLLEGLLYLVLRLPYFIFAILNSLFILLGARIIAYLLGWGHPIMTVFLIVYYLCIPMDDIITVGIQPGGINYLWAFVFALCGLIPIKKASERSVMPCGVNALCLASLVLGCNQEQIAAMSLVAFMMFIGWSIWTKKAIKTYCFLGFFITVSSILLHLTAPGNAVRMQGEIQIHWIGFEKLSLIDKLINGWITTVENVFAKPFLPVSLFVLSVVFYGFVFKKKKAMVLSAVLFVQNGLIIAAKVSDIVFKTNLIEGRIAAISLTRIPEGWEAPPIPRSPWVFIYSFMMILLIVLVVVIFWDRKRIMVFVFLAGLGSRMMMGLSPSLIASNTRTFLFLAIGVAACAMEIGQYIWEKFNQKMGTRGTIINYE